MKRSGDSEGEKRRKRRKLLQELGDQKISFLGPRDRGFQQLWDSSYTGLVLRRSCSLPVELHSQAESAFLTLRKKGCFLRDLVRVRDRDVFTAVSRALLGEPGHTYRYLDTHVSHFKEGERLFHGEKTMDTEVKQGDDEDSEDSKNSEGVDSDSRHSEDADTESKHSEEGCSGPKAEGEWETVSKNSKPNPKGQEDNEKPVTQLKHSLSDYHIEDKENEEAGCSQPNSPLLCTGPVKFNVTLLNYMDPAAMSQLKDEPYYGMGKMAVGWHHDENLVTHSPVAVYSYSCCHDQKGESSEGGSSDTSFWKIGLKVAWDIHTPGLMLPLQSGDSYYMRDDLNSTHQHCVLAGHVARFSSTHRVAECSRGTLAYIQSRCQEALSYLRTDPETGSHSLLALLPTTLQHCEEIHNEVEFEWLRQYWFQGRRYTRFCSWWSRPMEQLENDWRLMETMTNLFLVLVEDDGRAGENRRDMAETLLSALTDRHQQRQTWRDR
uniref:Alpha-ketoglutarate-dependent dioxygenase FTO n=1 Tax=Knipowitschia caucasica TaxID=637954 RepID=A0AAV2LQP6_KNICA